MGVGGGHYRYTINRIRVVCLVNCDLNMVNLYHQISNDKVRNLNFRCIIIRIEVKLLA